MPFFRYDNAIVVMLLNIHLSEIQTEVFWMKLQDQRA